MKEDRNEYRVWFSATICFQGNSGARKTHVLQVLGRTAAECACVAENCCEPFESVHDLMYMGTFREYMQIYGDIHEETKRGTVEYTPRINPSQLRLDFGRLS